MGTPLQVFNLRNSLCEATFTNYQMFKWMQPNFTINKEDTPMVRLIVGHKGKGKTTEILARVNAEIKTASGSIVYLDKSNKHIYELNNRIRYIDVSRFPIRNSDQFVGFICGIISQDHDIESMYLDGFMTCAKLEGQDVTETILELDRVSTLFNIKFVISLSLDKSELAPELQDKVLLAL